MAVQTTKARSGRGNVRTAPGVPTGLTAAAISSTEISLDWDTPYSSSAKTVLITGWKVYRSLTSNGTYSLVTTVTVSNYTDTGLTEGTTYYYKVSAVGDVESALTSAVSATTQGDYQAPAWTIPDLVGVDKTLDPIAKGGYADLTPYYSANDGTPTFSIVQPIIAAGGSDTSGITIDPNTGRISVSETTPADSYAVSINLADSTVVVPPAEPVGKYRYEQPYLFQSVRGEFEASRLAGGVALPMENGNLAQQAIPLVGPTRVYVDPLAGWAWDNLGGDWLDANQARQGNSAWFTVPLNSVSGSAAVAPYSVPVTAALQFTQSNDRPAAFLLRGSGAASRAIATKFNGTYAAPSIAVTYTDGSTGTLANRLVAANTSGSSYPSTTAAAISLPVFVEFERPTKAVQSATMSFTITQHWSGTTSLQGMVLDAPRNTDPVQTGIAYTQPLDAGLVGHPDIVHVHRYLDGTAQSDFIYPNSSINTNDEAVFDPNLYDPLVPQDTTKLPHIGQGKWVGAGSAWSLVPSSYSAEGFAPLVSGLGAMRVHMAKPAGMADGFVGGFGGTGPSNAFLYMPADTFGLEDHLFTRHYIRIGTPNGAPYRMPIAEKYHVYKAVGQSAWTDTAGKWGLMPDHMTYPDGGNSGASGGGWGWQMRLSWTDTYQDDTGPDLGGVGCGLHTYDFQSNNPIGFRYGAGVTDPGGDTAYDSGLGQRGGIGAVIYADKWYCIESEMKLNRVGSAPLTISQATGAVVTLAGHGLTNGQRLGFATTGALPSPLVPVTTAYYVVNATANTFQIATTQGGTPITTTTAGSGVHTISFVDDGIIRVWVDGRLALERFNVVVRSLPKYVKVGGVPTTPPPYRAGSNRPVRDVGIKSVWFNWFHGGLTQNSIPRTLFVTGVACGHSYIGPMRLT